jgi:bifunctional DNase/RNase
MTLLQVTGLTRKPDSDDATLILRDAAGDRGLGFVIPMNEANRLARVLGLGSCRCAPVYELLLDLARHGGLVLERAVLDGDAEGICAAVVVRRDGEPVEVSCHPADAVALAVRSSSPIYATAAAMAHACPLVDGCRRSPEVAAADSPASGAGDPDVARWLDGVRPEDFGPAVT